MIGMKGSDILRIVDLMHRERGVDKEIIVVDDGSTDKTAANLARRIASGFDARLVRFTRNFGHQSAVCAGIDLAEGGVVVVMDADLQDQPEAILRMLALWRRGADVVYASRGARRGSPLKRLGYWAFYRMAAFFSSLRERAQTHSAGSVQSHVDAGSGVAIKPPTPPAHTACTHRSEVRSSAPDHGVTAVRCTAL